LIYSTSLLVLRLIRVAQEYVKSNIRGLYSYTNLFVIWVLVSLQRDIFANRAMPFAQIPYFLSANPLFWAV
jgi:hypothetical protein